MAPPSAEETARRAVQHHQAGQLKEAEALYQQVLAGHPDEPDALHLLGVLLGQTGRPSVAIESIARAIALNPHSAEYHNSHGNVLRDCGEVDAAIDAFREATRIMPDYAEAYSNMGNALRSQGKFDAALAAHTEVETTVRLPHCYWCYQPPGATPSVNRVPAVEAGHITFGCLNNFCKVTRPALDLWSRILRALPQSRLLLHCNPGSHRDEVRRIFAAAVVDPARADFVEFQQMDLYFQQYQRVDIALDPFPCCGGTTTCDALWMGVPVITLSGGTAVGRSGVSLLSNVGLRGTNCRNA